jgi:hypothetical protein
MTNPSIIHRSMTRHAKDEEVSADSVALIRIRQMFPTPEDVMSLSPEHARLQIETWLPFLEAGAECCDTLPGIEAARAVIDTLADLQRTPNASDIRGHIVAAFNKLDEAAATLASVVQIPA